MTWDKKECEHHPGEEHPCFVLCTCGQPCFLHEPDGDRAMNDACERFIEAPPKCYEDEELKSMIEEENS